MTKEESAQDWLRMFKSLTDPEQRAKAKRIAEREKRKEDKKEDSGI